MFCGSGDIAHLTSDALALFTAVMLLLHLLPALTAGPQEHRAEDREHRGKADESECSWRGDLLQLQRTNLQWTDLDYRTHSKAPFGS